MNMKDLNSNKDFKLLIKNIIQQIKNKEQVNDQNILDSWLSIEKIINKSNKSKSYKTWFIYSASIAASIIFLIIISSIIKIPQRLSSDLLTQQTFDQTSKNIILTNQNKIIEVKENSSLNYEKTGKLSVKEKEMLSIESIDKNTKIKSENIDKELNQLFVPKGKSIKLTLSDGSKIVVNSGTRIIYPSVFSNKYREILVDGEIYIEVSKDSNRPFFVKTNNFDIKVLGTQFNLNSYNNSKTSTVVLVEGSIEVNTNTGETKKLKPNQLIELNENKYSIMNVDVTEYISWKDNLILLNNKKLHDVFKKITSYYGYDIIFNESIANIPVSGKLYISENIEQTISALCLSVGIKYELVNNQFLIFN